MPQWIYGPGKGKRMTRFIRKLKPASMFARICALMLALALFVVLFLSLYSVYTGSRNMERQMVRTGTETVGQVSGMVSGSLQTLAGILNSTFMESDVIRTLLSPELVRVENMQSVTRALTAAADASNAIDAIYVYSARNMIGLSSDYTVSGWQTDSWLGVLSRFLTRRGKLVPVVVDGVPVYYYTEGTEAYIVRGFPDVRYDGCSCYTLMHIAGRAFGESVNASETGAIRIFNAEGAEMFAPQGERAELRPAAEVWNAVRTSDGDPGSVLTEFKDGTNAWVISRADPETGWTCVYVSELSHGFIDRLGRSVPAGVLMWAAFLLFGAAFITVGAKQLTKPLERLVESVRGTASAEPADGDEWTFLGETYTRLADRKAELEQYLPIAAGAVEEDLFRSLLVGDLSEKEETERRLEFAGSPFTLDTPAAVFFCDVSEGEDAETNAMVDTVAYFELKDRLKSLLSEQEVPFVIMRGRSATAVLVCALHGKDTEKAYHILCTMFSELTLSGGTPVWGFGRPVTELLSLSASREDAARNLDYYRYHRGGAADETGPGAYRRTIEFLHDLSGRIRNGSAEDLQAETERTIRDISDSVLETGLRRELYRMLLDILLTEDPGYDGAVTAETLLPQELPDEEFERHAARLCVELAVRVAEGMASGQDKRILRVCRYIESHYQDAGLSLEQAAEYAGVSPAHLSRSFTAAMQKNFTAYLNEYRVESAKKLLETTELPAQEVGYLTGFCSMATFFRVFKKITGVTPKQYRSGSAGTETEQ